MRIMGKIKIPETPRCFSCGSPDYKVYPIGERKISLCSSCFEITMDKKFREMAEIRDTYLRFSFEIRMGIMLSLVSQGFDRRCIYDFQKRFIYLYEAEKYEEILMKEVFDDTFRGEL